MVKAGLIAGAVMFVLALGSALISPFCTPCVALLVGLGAGFLAGQFDKPFDRNEAFKKGAFAGAIAGGVGLLGQIVGGVINASMVSPETMNSLFGSDVVTTETMWIAQLGGAFCVGLFNVLLMAGLGVGGAAIWHAMNNKNQVTPPTSYPPQY